jgi:hypothetical protein
MSKFEKASRMKLSFVTDKGVIVTEDLWDLPLSKLNKLAVSLNKEVKASSEENFLEETSVEDATTKLRFDIVLSILETKKAERDARAEASSRKAEREKIMGILAKKQDDALETMTEAELQKKLDELK